MKRLILFTAFVLIITAGVLHTSAQTKVKTIDIKIYLLDRFEQSGPPTARDLFAVKRTIIATDPLTEAIKSLIDGPTDDELNTLKLYPTVEHIDLLSVIDKGKTVRINLGAWDINLIDAIDIRLFRQAALKTLRQIKPISKVEVCLDGIANFDRTNRKTRIVKCSLFPASKPTT